MHFQTATEYTRLYRGAHKRPATMVGAPALVCHLGLWQPDCPRGEWKDILDAFIRNVLGRLSTPQNDLHVFDHASLPPAAGGTGSTDLFSGRLNRGESGHQYEKFPEGDAASADPNHVVSLAFFWSGIRCIVRCELQLEYFLITIIMDLSVAAPTDMCGDDAARDLRAGIVQSLARINTDVRKSSPANVVIGPSKETRAAHANLYETVWTAFCDDVFRGFELHTLGQVFADFRGLVLGTEKHSKPAVHKPFWRPFDGPSSHSYTILRDESYWQQFTHALWPFLQSDRRIPLRQYEFTVSRVLDGRGLFASALGPQPKYTYDGTDRVPLLFLIVFDGHNTWQLGRLIQTLTHLGTLRIAATKDFDALREREDALRVIETELAKRTNELGRLLAPGISSDPETEKRISGITESGEQLRSRLAESAWLGQYSLNFRVEQSRGYRSEFTRTLKLLRLKRLEGLQPYDAFVDRRLGQSFDFIQRVGSRFEKAQLEISTLFKQLQSNRTEKNFKTVVTLQAVGEVALWAAILPYYIGSILTSSMVPLIVSIANSGCDNYVGRLAMVLEILTWFTVALIGWRMAIDRFQELMPDLYNRPKYRLLRVVNRLLSLRPTVSLVKLLPLVVGAVMVAMWFGMSLPGEVTGLCPYFESGPDPLPHKG